MGIFSKVAIVGVGLIGGSLGMAIKKNKLARQVAGVARHRQTLKEAIKRRAIDNGSLDLSIIKDADLIILATPVNTILELAPKIIKIANKNSIIMDVGSTKEVITKKIEGILPKGIYFIGSHPLAGSEKRSINFASADLFQDCLCMLTTTKNSNKVALNKIKKFWLNLGAKIEVTSVFQHDKILSLISHLPHLLAFSLVNTPPKSYLKYAASGFKDTTRIASSDPIIWRDIFLTNEQKILRAIKIFTKKLNQLSKLIAKKDSRGLEKAIRLAKIKRDAL